MQGKSKKEDFRGKVRDGYTRMKNYKVAICSTVRDCELSLRTNIPIINELREHFGESIVVVVENDSKDLTKGILSEWARNANGVYILSEDIGVQTIPRASGTVKPWFSTHRIQLMAYYRNKYLDFIEDKGWKADYIIVVDLDVGDISIDGIASSFGQNIEWHAITSNGKTFTRRGYCYYDTYAFRETGDKRPQTEESIYTYQNLLKGLTVGMAMFRVASAFGGLAIYRAEAIKGLRYRCAENRDINVGALSENVSIHQDMSKNGYDLIYLNPSQEVIYDSFLGILKRISRRMTHKLIYPGGIGCTLTRSWIIRKRRRILVTGAK